MFDLWFKNMKVIEDYVGNFTTSEIVVEYNTKVVSTSVSSLFPLNLV